MTGQDSAAAAVPDPGDPAPSAAAPPTEVVQAIQRRDWMRGVFVLVAVMVLLVGIGWAVGAFSAALSTPAAMTALAQIEQSGDAQSASAPLGEEGGATLHWSESIGEAVVVASGLPEPGADETFELWFVRGGVPISAGTFDAPGGDATVLLAGQLQAGDAVAITIEPQGGAPEGVPTADALLTITPEAG